MARRAALSFVVSIAAASIGCTSHEPRTTVGVAPASEPVSATTARSTGDGGSLYDLGIAVTGADGAPLDLGSLRHRPVLAAMFFASCPSACPLLVQRLKQLDARLPPELREGLTVLLVSFDPARDTPAALRAVATRYRLDPRRWKLGVAADEAQARLMATALGVRYRPTEGGMIAHTNRIVLLDGDGRERAAAEDFGPAAEDVLLPTIRALRDVQPAPGT